MNRIWAAAQRLIDAALASLTVNITVNQDCESIQDRADDNPYDVFFEDVADPGNEKRRGGPS